MNISIHAPHAGRDFFGYLVQLFIVYFNPRAPCGARLDPSDSDFAKLGLFQSTRPMRGATSRPAHPQHLQTKISIHAPHAGRDHVPSCVSMRISTFQSTRPMRGATVCNSSPEINPVISIHAPHAGRD